MLRRAAPPALAMALVVPWLAASSAHAESPMESGWWWKGRANRTVPAAVAPVPAVPDGGLYVANDATGPAGVSMLRFDLPEDAESAVITLKVAEAVGTPAITACPAVETVTPEAGGPWDERAEADCNGVRADGALDATAGTLRFDLGSVMGPGILDVVLVPAANLAPDRAVFSVALDPPDDNTIEITLAEDFDDDTTTTTEAGPFPVDGGSDFGSVSELPTEAPAEPAPAQQPQQQAWVAESVPASQLLDDVTVEGFRYAGIVVLPLALLLFGGYFGWALTRPVIARSGVAAR